MPSSAVVMPMPRKMGLTPEQEARLADYFVPMEAPYEPGGNYILVQQRRTPTKSKGGIIMADETRDKDDTVEHACRIVSFGQTVGIDEYSGEMLPEWPWYEPGDYVLVPRTSSARYVVPCPDRPGEVAVFRMVTLREIFGRITDPAALLR